MQNGCLECQRLPDDVLCNKCYLGYLEWEYNRARNAYIARLDAYKQELEKEVKKLKEKQNASKMPRMS